MPINRGFINIFDIFLRFFQSRVSGGDQSGQNMQPLDIYMERIAYPWSDEVKIDEKMKKKKKKHS